MHPVNCAASTRGTGSRIAVAAVLVALVIAGPSAVVQAVHPGSIGGLAYPVAGGLRVHDVQANDHYDLPIHGVHDVAWTPDGRFIALSVPGGSSPGLQVTDSAGCDVQRATTTASDRAPNFDGTALYFTRGSDTFTLDWSMDADGPPISGEPEFWASATDVAVSVIEGRWAYVEPPDLPDTAEYVLMVDSLFDGEITEVHRSPDPILGIEWSPNGTLLAFEATGDDGSTQIFLADVTEQPIMPWQVTDSSPHAMSPAFSPDGAKLAYLVGPSDASSGIVWTLDLDSGEVDFVSQQAKGRLDWQPVHSSPASRPTETVTTISLDEPVTGPGIHDITITVTPAPASGSVVVTIDGDWVTEAELEEATGTAHATVVVDDGTTIGGEFVGSCPHLGSAAQLTVDIPEPMPTPSPAPAPPPSFGDIEGSSYRRAIEWLASEGIAKGCAEDRFCPTDPVSRAQMATFLVRVLGLTAGGEADLFTDDDGTTHEDDINRLATAGITAGCGAARYCPRDPVPREQMASFLVRALRLTAGDGSDLFTDDDGSTHERAIDRLATAGITSGCGERLFCPMAAVTREQMAAFLYRAFAD